MRLYSSIRWAAGVSVVIFTFNEAIQFYQWSDFQLHLYITVFCWKQWLLSVESTAVTVIRLSLIGTCFFGNVRLSGLLYNPNHWILMMVKPWQEMEVGVAGQGLFHTWRRVPVSKVYVRRVHALTDIPTRMKSMINLPLFSAGDGFNLCLVYIIHFSLHYTFYGCFYFETMCSQAVYPCFSA